MRDDNSPLKDKKIISASGAGLMCLLSSICIATTGSHSSSVVTQLRAAIDSATATIAKLPDNLRAALHSCTGAFAAPDITTKTRLLEAADLIIAAVAALSSRIGFRVWSTTADGTRNGTPLKSLTVVMEVKGTTDKVIDLVLYDNHYHVGVDGKPNGDTLDIRGCVKNLRIPTPDEATLAVTDLAKAIANSLTLDLTQQRRKQRRNRTASPSSSLPSANSEEEESLSDRSSTTLSGSTNTDSESDSPSHDGNASAASGTVSLNPRANALRRSPRVRFATDASASSAASSATAPPGTATQAATA